MGNLVSMNCCEKYKDKKCPELLTGEKLYNKCKEKQLCLSKCSPGYYRDTYESDCKKYIPDCGLNEYRKSPLDPKCYDIKTRKPVEGFMNFKNGKLTGMCPYAMVQILLFSVILYLLIRLKDVKLKR